jgi:hypothetical protein
MLGHVSVLTEHDVDRIADRVVSRIRSEVVPEPLGVPVAEAARRLGVSAYTVRKYVRTGKLGAVPGLPCVRVATSALREMEGARGGVR